MEEESGRAPAAPSRSPDEIALDLMKFVVVTTGYGKGAASAGYTGKTATSAEEHAEALLGLYQRCRTLLKE